MYDIERIKKIIKECDLLPYTGTVTGITGQIVESDGPSCRVGDLTRVVNTDNSAEVLCEVAGFKNNRLILMPYDDVGLISPGARVEKCERGNKAPVSLAMTGRILDALGRPIDKKGPLIPEEFYDLNRTPPDPMDRLPVNKPIKTGIKAIDGLLTMGEGQRIGLFAGSGVGKSTLLGMIAKKSQADINVIGLIGERGREVREFIDRDLGEAGLKKSIVIVATSDTPAVLRMKAALLATTVAEFFRDKGKRVMLMIDSLTRYAMAVRDMGLAIGELPVARGYTPSLYPLLAKLLERAGNSDKASITAIYTVLVEDDEMNEPVTDNTRAILDGHVVLSRTLASANHYPAINVLSSISRIMPGIVTQGHLELAGSIRNMMAEYEKIKDLIAIGAYKKGINPSSDKAIDKRDAINAFLRQGTNDETVYDDITLLMSKI